MNKKLTKSIKLDHDYLYLLYNHMVFLVALIYWNKYNQSVIFLLKRNNNFIYKIIELFFI